MSPAYNTLVYGEPRKINVSVVGGEEEVEEMQIYGDKMKLRGEIFLTCGN